MFLVFDDDIIDGIFLFPSAKSINYVTGIRIEKYQEIEREKKSYKETKHSYYDYDCKFYSFSQFI